MKTIKKLPILFILAFAVAMGGATWFLLTSDSGDTGGEYVQDDGRHARLQATPTTSVIISINPSLGPLSSKPAFEAYALKELSQISGAGGVSSNTITYIANPNNAVVVSTGDENIIWEWVCVSAVEGEVSLDQVSGVFSSSDPGNTLRRTVSFVGRSYTKLAFGVRADGSIIDSGPASQAVKKLYFGVSGQYFLPKVSPGDWNEIAGILATPNWHLTHTITVNGISASKTLGLVKPETSRRLKATKASSTTVLLKPEVPGNYILQTSTTFAGPYVDLVGITDAGVTVPTSDPRRFYRLK